MATDNSRVFPIQNQGFPLYYLFILKAICLAVKGPSALTAYGTPDVSKAWLPKRIFQIAFRNLPTPNHHWTVLVPKKPKPYYKYHRSKETGGRFKAFLVCRWRDQVPPDSPWKGFCQFMLISNRQSFQPLALFRMKKPLEIHNEKNDVHVPLEMGWSMMHVPRCFGMLCADCNCHSDTDLMSTTTSSTQRPRFSARRQRQCPRPF